MKKSVLVAATAIAAFVAPATAFAQEETAPDGSEAFGFEPYVAVTGGYFSFDRDTSSLGIPNRLNGQAREGAIVEGALGANIPLGPLFVGVEGNVAKGVEGEIDWQYGVSGRAGFRAGESGLVYVRAGYQWVNFTDRAVTGDRDYGHEVYGLGVEVGPRDIGLGGITGESGARIRFELQTDDFESIRPSAGVVFHF